MPALWNLAYKMVKKYDLENQANLCSSLGFASYWLLTSMIFLSTGIFISKMEITVFYC